MSTDQSPSKVKEETDVSPVPQDLRLILLAPPGAGKGTQSRILSRLHKIPHIETGAILRHEIREESELGLKAKKYTDTGDLVPDELIVKIVRNRLEAPDCESGFILDGFPRTVPQAQELEFIFQESEHEIDAVVFLDVSDEEIFKRLTKRRICSACGKTYHLKVKPPKEEGICDDCGSELIRREDDYRESIEHRLDVYRDMTEPLLDFYQDRGLLVSVNGEQSIQTVNQEITKKLKNEVLSQAGG